MHGLQFRRFIEAGEDFESDEDPGFLEHCEGRYVFLSKAPKSIPPYVVPPNYLVETLTGLAQMGEKDAKVSLSHIANYTACLGPTTRTKSADQGSQQAKTRQDQARLTKTALNPVLSRLGLVFIKPLDKRSSRLALPRRISSCCCSM